MGPVAFGVSPTSAIMVPEVITRFRQQFPQTRVHIAEGLPQLLLPLVRDETLSFAIGQGYLLVSPLQILRLTSIIAKNGYKIEPRIILEDPVVEKNAPGGGRFTSRPG